VHTLFLLPSVSHRIRCPWIARGSRLWLFLGRIHTIVCLCIVSIVIVIRCCFISRTGIHRLCLSAIQNYPILREGPSNLVGLRVPVIWVVCVRVHHILPECDFCLLWSLVLPLCSPVSSFAIYRLTASKGTDLLGEKSRSSCFNNYISTTTYLENTMTITYI